MNNRPIKFRAWDTKNKKWLTAVPSLKYLLDDEDECVSHHDIDPESAIYSYPHNLIGNTFDDRIIWQQFTGALDKKNRQIFEGDIVLFDNPDPYDGQDQLTKIVGYNSRVMGFRLYNFTHEVDKYGGQVFFPEEVEVIGNIFEGAIKDGINYGEYLKEK
jgi:uncharacterized phage protein (TIGR01671 family)